MPDVTVLPTTILQRLGAEPAMLAVLMAGGVGVTAIGASVQGQADPATPPAAEAGKPMAPSAAAVAPTQPVLLDAALEPIATLAAPDGGPSVTVGQESEAAVARQVIAEPVPATVLGPYVPLPPIETAPSEPSAPHQAEPAPASEQIELAAVEPTPEPTADSAATEQAEPPRAAPEPELVAEVAPIVEQPAATEPAAAVTELAAEEPTATEPEPDPLPQVAFEAPVEQSISAAPAELAVEEAAEPASVEELAAEEPTRAVEPAEQGNAFALAFADLPKPDFAPETLAEAEPIAAAVVAPAPELAPAPAPAIASVAFDLAAMPSGMAVAEPGSAFVRPDEAAGAAQAAQSPARSRDVPGNRYRLTGNGIEFRIPAVLFGEELGTVPLRIGSTNLVSVRLGDLLVLVAGRMDPTAHARLAGSRNADEYVSFSALRDAGIDLRYDAANDRLILGE